MDATCKLSGLRARRSSFVYWMVAVRDLAKNILCKSVTGPGLSYISKLVMGLPQTARAITVLLEKYGAEDIVLGGMDDWGNVEGDGLGVNFRGGRWSMSSMGFAAKRFSSG